MSANRIMFFKTNDGSLIELHHVVSVTQARDGSSWKVYDTVGHTYDITEGEKRRLEKLIAGYIVQ